MFQSLQIGPYRLSGLLGRGGMGVVYRGEHRETGKVVALKTVRVLHETMLQGLRREIHALARVSHPGIVRILEEGVHEGAPWYAMELVEGIDLKRYYARLVGQPLGKATAMESSSSTRQKTQSIRLDETWSDLPVHEDGFEEDEASGSAASEKSDSSELTSLYTSSEPLKLDRSGPVDTGASKIEAKRQEARQEPQPSLLLGNPEAARAILTVIRRLCATLAYLHGEGIVHRDIKPSNILVRSYGTPVLVDFGLMSHFRGKQNREELDLGRGPAGTVIYMAPEAILNRSFDARIDLYALGCILYELITGRPPFVGKTPKDIVLGHLYIEPLAPSQIVKPLPSELDDLLLSLLAKRPRDRLGHAGRIDSVLARMGADPPSPEAIRPPRAYLYRPEIVGRRQALAVLNGLLTKIHTWGGQFLLVSGETGIGKTRLVQEFARKTSTDGLPTFVGECAPPEARASEEKIGGTPLYPLRQLLQAVADRCREHGVEETERLLGDRGPLLAHYEPALTGLSYLDPRPEPASLPPGAARLRLFGYLIDLLGALAAERPVVLAIDDLHWADELTSGFLEFLVKSGRLSKVPLLIVASYRSEERTPAIELLRGQRTVKVLELGRLDEIGVGAMVGDMLAMSPPPKQFVRFLSRQSEGNPFFIAEYLQTAVSTGLLYRDELGHWQVKEETEDPKTLEAIYEALPLPRSLRKLVERRLDIVYPAARTLLECASILGREFPQDLLMEVSGLDEEVVLGLIEDLRTRAVFEEQRMGSLSFVHNRLREAAYDRVGTRRRRELHRRTAVALEHRGPASEDERLAKIGLHWQRAGEEAKARRCYLKAAKITVAHYAHKAAEGLYRAYLSITREPTTESVLARNELANSVLGIQGRNAEAIEELTKALAEAEEIGDSEALKQTLQNLAFCHRTTGDYEQSRGFINRALSVAHLRADRRFEGACIHHQGTLAWLQGENEEAGRLYRRALEILREAGDRQGEGMCLSNLTIVHWTRGNLDDARRVAEEALHLNRTMKDRRLEGATLSHLAAIHWSQGRLELAQQISEEALAIQRKIGFRTGEGEALTNLAEILRGRGHLDDARKIDEEALSIHREVGNRRAEGVTLGNLASFHHQRGKLDAALNLYQQSLLIHREIGDQRYEASALSHLGSLERDRGRLDSARHLLNEALRLHGNATDQLDTAFTFWNMAVLERWSGGPLHRVLQLVEQAEAILRRSSSFMLALCLCERGHVVLARGHSGRKRLEEAQSFAGKSNIHPDSMAGRAIQRLQRAVEEFEAGGKLHQGEAVSELPPTLYQTLVNSGILRR